MHADDCDNSTNSKHVAPQYRTLELALPQSETIPVLWCFCVGQISRKIGFKALKAFSLLASIYVVSRGVQYVEEGCPVASLRMSIHRILSSPLQNLNMHRHKPSSVVRAVVHVADRIACQRASPSLLQPAHLRHTLPWKSHMRYNE